jgi:hypothetical protein
MVFSSKKEATQEGQRLLRQAQQSGLLGRPIRAGDAGFEFLWHLWHHHPSAHEHAHKKISYFYIAENTDALRPSTCFWLRFADKYVRDFSFFKCLDNQQHKQTTSQGGWTGPSAPMTAAELEVANQQAQVFALILQKQQGQHARLLPQAWYDRALRRIIEEQVFEYKAKAFNATAPFKCPITGEIVSKFGDCHLDHHHPPFAVLADQWLSQQGLAMGGGIVTRRHVRSQQEWHCLPE